MPNGLSPRQTEIARLLAKGLAVKQVAVALGVSSRTVERQIHLAAQRLPGPARPQTKLLLWVLNPSEGDNGES